MNVVAPPEFTNSVRLLTAASAFTVPSNVIAPAPAVTIVFPASTVLAVPAPASFTLNAAVPLATPEFTVYVPFSVTVPSA